MILVTAVTAERKRLFLSQLIEEQKALSCLPMGGGKPPEPDLRLFTQTFLCLISCKNKTKMFRKGLTVWLSPAGVFAPTLFSKAYGHLVCDACTDSGGNGTSNSSGPFVCRNCHYDLVSVDIQLQHLTKERKSQTIYDFDIVSCVMPCYFFLQQQNGTLFHNHVE